MTENHDSDTDDGRQLLERVREFLSSAASSEAIERSRASIEATIETLHRAERIDAETLELTITL